MSADAPLITIGVTAYREGEWLAECWESILAQTDPRWEAVLVLDGGCDDKTRAVFDRLEHPRLRKLAMAENGGPYTARNEAFAMTRTPYHFYVDGDDRLPPDAVARVLETFADHPEADHVYGDYACFGARETTWVHPREVTAADFADGQPTPGGAAYKRVVWERLGGFARELARGNGDYDFLIGAYEAGFRGVHCGAIVYQCRIGHGDRVSSSYNRRYHETHEIMVRRHPRFFADRTLRRRFLTAGYRRAAFANQAAGDAATARRLGWAACVNGGWRDQGLQMLVLRNSLPNWSFRALQRLWRTGRAA